MFLKTGLIIAALAMALAISAKAQTAGDGSEFTKDGLLRNDPNRDVAAISSDLNVTSDEFVACFWNVNPETAGVPSGERQRTNKNILLPCLQSANSSISNGMLDRVMDSHRPEGPINPRS